MTENMIEFYASCMILLLTLPGIIISHALITKPAFKRLLKGSTMAHTIFVSHIFTALIALYFIFEHIEHVL